MATKPARNRPQVTLTPIVEDIQTPGTDMSTPLEQVVKVENLPVGNDQSDVDQDSLTSGPKSPVTMSLNTRLMAEAKRAVLVGAAQDAGPRSISGFAEEALRRYLKELQDELNGGQRFKPYWGEMKRGRSLG
ncbi:type II toxin-antitoxin system CcdA family antitoxin [Arthrobacter bambusae]